MDDNRYCVGISDNLDAGTAQVDGRGRIVSAINEERLSRRKMHAGFPLLSARRLAEEDGHSRRHVELVAMAGYESFLGDLGDAYQWYYQSRLLPRLPMIEPVVRAGKKLFLMRGRLWRSHRGEAGRLFGRDGARPGIRVVDHHLAHAAGAYYTSGFDEALILTMDGYGDGCSSAEWVGRGHEIKLLRRHGWGATVAHLYSRVTQFLGFRPHLHEGKVTGLAAYGDPGSCRPEMEKLLWLDAEGVVDSAPFLRIGFDRARLDRILGRFSREEIAAALQSRSEEVIVGWAKAALRATGMKNLAVAGGVFANVKINKCLHEIEGVESLWVFPHMGDGGLAAGAALAHVRPDPSPMEHALFGPAFTDGQIKEILDSKGIPARKVEPIEREIAARLARGETVARFSGPMEFGPRALGNRSILCRADDPSVNDWLNRKLKRTEFMPFAPVTLAEYGDRCYRGLGGAARSAEFMTVCFDCTEEFRRTCAGAVHVDRTARPQLVRREVNPGLHRILTEYNRITGVPSMINTSFNIHEEPIVHSPEEAIRAFEQGGLDCLAIGNFIVEGKGRGLNGRR